MTKPAAPSNHHILGTPSISRPSSCFSSEACTITHLDLPQIESQGPDDPLIVQTAEALTGLPAPGNPVLGSGSRSASWWQESCRIAAQVGSIVMRALNVPMQCYAMSTIA